MAKVRTKEIRGKGFASRQGVGVGGPGRRVHLGSVLVRAMVYRFPVDGELRHDRVHYHRGQVVPERDGVEVRGRVFAGPVLSNFAGEWGVALAHESQLAAAVARRTSITGRR